MVASPDVQRDTVLRDEVLRDVVRQGATLLPRVVAVVDRCRTEPDPGQNLARACGALVREYGHLRDRLADLASTPFVERVDSLLYLQQRVVNEAAHLAFRPRSEHWTRMARAFGDGLTSGADELLVLASRYQAGSVPALTH